MAAADGEIGRLWVCAPAQLVSMEKYYQELEADPLKTSDGSSAECDRLFLRRPSRHRVYGTAQKLRSLTRIPSMGRAVATSPELGQPRWSGCKGCSICFVKCSSTPTLGCRTSRTLETIPAILPPCRSRGSLSRHLPAKRRWVEREHLHRCAVSLGSRSGDHGLRHRWSQ